MVSIRFIAIIIFSFLLNACGSGEGDVSSAGQISSNETDSSNNLPTTTVFNGSIGDGPIIGAIVNAYDVDGNFLGSTNSTDSANYQLTVRTGRKSYPINIIANGGTDIVSNMTPEFLLSSVALTPADRKRININPFTTFIVKTASFMSGGLNDNNVAIATLYVTNALNFGLDTTLISDPIGVAFNGQTIANLIKASEVLSEAVRRTRDQLIAQGIDVSANQVIDSLSADLIDSSSGYCYSCKHARGACACINRKCTY